MIEIGSLADWSSALIASVALIFAVRSFRNSKKELDQLKEDRRQEQEDRKREQGAKIYFTFREEESQYVISAVNGSDLPTYETRVVIGLNAEDRRIGYASSPMLPPGGALDCEVEEYDGFATVLIYFRDSYGRYWLRDNYSLHAVASDEHAKWWKVAQMNERFPPDRWAPERSPSDS